MSQPSIQDAVARYTAFSDKFVRFMNTTTGRDRVNGLIQFLAQFVAWYSAKKGYTKSTVQSWRNLAVSVATSRRLFRIGRTQEFIRAISKSQGIKDAVVRWLQVARSVSLALWLGNDMLVWFHSIGFRSYPNITQISTRANRFWLLGALCGVMQDLYKLNQNAKALQRAEEKDGESLGRQRKEYVLQSIQDTLEALLAASLLGLVQIDEGMFAMIGLAATGLGFRGGWKAL